MKIVPKYKYILFGFNTFNRLDVIRRDIECCKMESQVNVMKSPLVQEQMPAQPPSYPEQPNFPPKYDNDVVTVQPVNAEPVIIANALGIEPVAMMCSSCNMRIATRIERVVWFRTHFMAGLLCLMGCWPCVPIPYCTHVCKKAIHYCPNCDAYIGTQL